MDLPLLEDDLAEPGVLEPAAVHGPRDVPARAVVCFFNEVIEAIAARTPGFPRALLDNNVGTVLLARGDRAGARLVFERSIDDARTVGGPGALELLATRLNLSLVDDDPGHREQILSDADAAYTRMLGVRHPDTITSIVFHATISVIEYPKARAMLADACPTLAEYTLRAASAGECSVELSDLAAASGGPRDGAAWEPTLEEIAEHRLAESEPWASHFGITPTPIAAWMAKHPSGARGTS